MERERSEGGKREAPNPFACRPFHSTSTFNAARTKEAFPPAMRAWVCWCGSGRQRVVGIGLNSFGGDGRIVIGGADNQARRRGSPTRRTRTSRRDAPLRIDNIKGKVPEYGFRFRTKRKSKFKCPGRPLFLFKLVSGKLVLCGGGGFYQCYYEP